jgi:GNAT superfamily N-acetyltransferase
MITAQSLNVTDAAPPDMEGKMMPPIGASSGKAELVAPTDVEWAIFAGWARAEGWRVPAVELTLYRQELAASAFVLRGAVGEPCGFVTVCRHQRSAWIGNLLVDPQRRGAGVGRRLFGLALTSLVDSGSSSQWLTASAQGRPLYAQHGFREAGRVERWVWSGVGGGSPVSTGNLPELLKADAAAWGDARGELLGLLSRRGRIFSSGSSTALLQPGEELQVLGPWLSADLCPRSNRLILGMVLEGLSGPRELATDLIGGSPVRALLQAAGFRQTGETVLMVRGAPGPVRFGEIVALATLGSMG